MPRETESALLDIVDACRGAVRIVSQGDVLDDEDRLAALQYYLIILGEAVKRLPREFRDEHATIQWSAIAGLRDMLVHRYDRIDNAQIWRIAAEDVPELMRYVEPLAPKRASD